MNTTDPIADLLTRIRNANKALLPNVSIPFSKMKEAVVSVLTQEGYVKGYEVLGDGVRKSIVVSLKYTPKRERTIERLERVSKPGKRVYVGHDDIKPVRGGLGIAILSTPKGIVTDATAKKDKVGGEWLCSIW